MLSQVDFFKIQAQQAEQEANDLKRQNDEQLIEFEKSNCELVKETDLKVSELVKEYNLEREKSINNCNIPTFMDILDMIFKTLCPQQELQI